MNYFDTIDKFCHENFYEKYLICGSVIEKEIGINVTTTDIDLVVIDSTEFGEHTINYNGININVTYLSTAQLIEALDNLYPKYLLSKFSTGLNTSIFYNVLNKKSPTDVVSIISSFSEKELNLAKLSLTTSSPHDIITGITHLFNSIKFLLYAKWFYIYPNIDDSGKLFEKDVDLLNSICDSASKSNGGDTVLSTFLPLYSDILNDFKISFTEV